MIFPVIYIATIWWLSWVYRRRWIGVAVAALSPAPIVGLFLAIEWLAPSLNILHEPAAHILGWPLVGVVMCTAMLIALAPRSIPPHHCQACGYDLRGNIVGLCPECGGVYDAGVTGGVSPAPASADQADRQAW